MGQGDKMLQEEKKFLELLKFRVNNVKKEQIKNIPSTIAQLLLTTSNPSLPEFYIGGGYATFMCGRTVEYGDIDLFCLIKPNSANSLYHCLVEFFQDKGIKFQLKTILQKQQDYAWAKRKIVLTVKAEDTDKDEKQTDIVIVEAKTIEDLIARAPNLMHCIQYIVSDHDLDVCRCVGIPMKYTNIGCTEENMILFFPLGKTHEFVISKRDRKWIKVANVYIQRGYNPGNQILNKVRKTKVFDNVFRQHDNRDGHTCDAKKLCLRKKLSKSLLRYGKYERRLQPHVKTIDRNDDQAIESFVSCITKVMQAKFILII